MEMINVLTWALCVTFIVQIRSTPEPGHHVHHRIYVPQKIKTIHHTKIIKVPQHHHYFHEKEKIIQVEVPHHKEEYKPSYKDLHDHEELSSFDHDEGLDSFSEYHSKGHHHFGGSSHNIFKKHAVISKNHKRGITKRKNDEKDEDDKKEK